ncbi:unnamed protein product [Diamesa tonsa]
MRNLFMLCILLGVLSSIKSDEIACEFKDDPDWASDLPMYGCFATKLDVPVSYKIYDGAYGNHKLFKNKNDVKHLGIRDSEVMFMPQRLDRIFNLT